MSVETQIPCKYDINSQALLLGDNNGVPNVYFRLNKYIVTALITTAFALLSFMASDVLTRAAEAQDWTVLGERPRHPHAREPWVPLPPLRQLDLTSTQRELVRGLINQHRDNNRTAREQLVTIRQALHDAVTTAVVDSGLIRSLASENARLKGETSVQQAYLYSQVWQLLTPDQQTLAQEIETDRRQRRNLRRERMDRRRGRQHR